MIERRQTNSKLVMSYLKSSMKNRLFSESQSFRQDLLVHCQHRQSSVKKRLFSEPPPVGKGILHVLFKQINLPCRSPSHSWKKLDSSELVRQRTCLNLTLWWVMPGCQKKKILQNVKSILLYVCLFTMFLILCQKHIMSQLPYLGHCWLVDTKIVIPLEDLHFLQY